MKKYSLVLVLFMAQLSLRAQVIEELSPREKKQLTKVTEPITLYKGFLRAGLSANFSVLDKMFDEDGNKTSSESSISGYSLTTIFSLHYGISDRLEVEANLPYASSMNSTSFSYELAGKGEVVTEHTKPKTHGLADAIVMLRYQLLREKENSPAVTFGLGVNLPIGKDEVSDYKNPREFNGAIAKGEWGVFPEIKVRKVMYPFSVELGAGLLKYFGAEKVLIPNTRPVDVVSGSELLITPKVNFLLNEWVSFSNYFDYYLALKDDFDGEDPFGYHNNEYNQWMFRYSPIITFQIKQLRIEQAVFIPLAGRTVTADPTYYFIVQYMF